MQRVPYLYRAWCNMRHRCRSEAYYTYKKGIQVSAEWDDFFEFQRCILSEIGHRPMPKHSLDRIDNDGHYEPGNLRWATAWQQAQNTGRVLYGSRLMARQPPPKRSMWVRFLPPVPRV